MSKNIIDILEKLFDKPNEDPTIFINEKVKKLMSKPNAEVSQIIQNIMAKKDITFGETIIMKRLLDLIDNTPKSNKNNK